MVGSIFNASDVTLGGVKSTMLNPILFEKQFNLSNWTCQLVETMHFTLRAKIKEKNGCFFLLGFPDL